MALFSLRVDCLLCLIVNVCNSLLWIKFWSSFYFYFFVANPKTIKWKLDLKRIWKSLYFSMYCIYSCVIFIVRCTHFILITLLSRSRAQGSTHTHTHSICIYWSIKIAMSSGEAKLWTSNFEIHLIQTLCTVQCVQCSPGIWMWIVRSFGRRMWVFVRAKSLFLSNFFLASWHWTNTNSSSKWQSEEYGNHKEKS